MSTSALDTLQRLPCTTLKSLARLCGLSPSYRKAILAANITHAISPFFNPPSSSPSSSSSTPASTSARSSLSTFSSAADHAAGTASRRPYRVLSIDLGLRNFSYSVLDLPPRPTSTDPLSSPRPLLAAWSVADVIQSSFPSLSPSSAPTDIPLSPSPINISAFSSAQAAAVAYDLFAETLLPRYEPDVIIFERQRLRSGGGHAVIEWTLRINMFESALQGVFVALNRQGRLRASVCDVLPSTTKAYWIRSEKKAETTTTDPEAATTTDNKKSRKSKSSGSTYALSKAAKVALVKKWTENVTTKSPDSCPHVVFSPDTIPLAMQFNTKKTPKSKFKPPTDPSPLLSQHQHQQQEDDRFLHAPTKFKLDDLADSLLQGVAFIEWQQHQYQLARALKAGDDLESLNRELCARHEEAMLSM